MNDQSKDLLWWVLPDVLAGMPMPYVHSTRRSQRGGALNQYDDELPVLYAAGVRSVVCLLNIPSDEKVYKSAGFSFLSSHVPDYSPPSMEQAVQIVDFISNAPKAVAVHCEGGIGRTGTIIAAYLIKTGSTAKDAIDKVRGVEPAAIETKAQVDFLYRFEQSINKGKG